MTECDKGESSQGLGTPWWDHRTFVGGVVSPLRREKASYTMYTGQKMPWKSA